MSTHDDGLPDPLGAEFLAYRDRLMPEVHPAGIAAVRRTVRRRRRVAVAVVAAVVLAGVAVPVAALAMFDGRRAAQEHGTDVTPTPPAPSTPAPTPSTTPGTPPTATPPPDGRITRTQLLAAAVDLPEWPPGTPRTCGTKGVRLHDGWIGKPGPILREIRHGDVDRDGASETVADVSCPLYEDAIQQLVAFDRDPAGRIVVLGRVVATGGRIGQLAEFRADPDGAVRVRVCSGICSIDPINNDVGQWRAYRWTGAGFRQTGGPTSFPTRPPAPPPVPPPTATTPLTITATPLTYGPPDDNGVRRGAVTVTIANPGATTVEYPTLEVPTDSRHEAEHASWTGWVSMRIRNSRFVVVADPLPPGEEHSLTLVFFTRLTGPIPTTTATVRVDIGASRDGTPLVPGTGDQTTFTISAGS